MTRIEQLLRQRIGLDPGSIGVSSIHRTVRLRMKRLGITDTRTYGNLLQQSAAEWSELLETIIVKETWFFRDGEPFDAFVRLVQEHCGRDAKRPVRVLSVPCSSGEEPYSLVMALLDAGVKREHFQIDAADISSHAIVRARRAIYNRNSFRGNNLSFRDRYFHHTKEGYVLCPAVRTAVRFFEANVLDANFLGGQQPYEIIFCRNLLIYFDQQTQAIALKQISRLLSSSGFLIVGAAEQPLAFNNGFASANIPMAFACRKAASKLLLDHPTRPHPAKLLKLPALPKAPDHNLNGLSPSALQDATSPRPSSLPNLGSASRADDKLRRSQSAGTTTSPESLPDLIRARRLADQGKLEDAASLCQAHLRLDASSAQGWYLLGLVSDAMADPTAIECYRKALYLNPNHYETLLQMALLSEKSGDLPRAQTFRQRAARMKPKSVNASEDARV